MQMRDNNRIFLKFNAKLCKKFIFVQTGLKWDINERVSINVIGLDRIELFS